MDQLRRNWPLSALVAIVVATFVWACLAVTVGFGVIGFLDDYDKVKKRSTAGLSSKLRLGLEFLVAGIASYIIVSWIAAFTFPDLWRGLGPTGFALVLAGGICYTVGAIALATRWPDPWPRVFGFHEVFHAFTVVGAALQFTAIAWFVAPRLSA